MQTISDSGRGDCQRAVIASLFGLEIEQVPHFRLYGNEWAKIYSAFLDGLGYEFVGTGHFKAKGYTPRSEHLKDCNVGGYVDASVPSKNYDGCTHSVVMYLDGLVVHDPHPGKAWEGINVIETGDLISFSLIKKRFDRLVASQPSPLNCESIGHADEFIGASGGYLHWRCRRCKRLAKTKDRPFDI